MKIRNYFLRIEDHNYRKEARNYQRELSRIESYKNII